MSYILDANLSTGEMKEGSRDEAKYFMVRMMRRMVDIMSERSLELDFRDDPQLSVIDSQLKVLKGSLGDYLEPWETRHETEE